MNCLETERLSYRYPDGNLVLDDVALRVPRGSIYGFLGPNGAGKTTTLRLVLGLLKRQRGCIEVFGKAIDSHRVEILRDVGALIEMPSSYEHLSARENLVVLQKIHRCPLARVAQVIDVVGLTEYADKRVGRFSLGMKQRLGIAAALLHSPALLILDEPTNGLDPGGIIEMRGLLAALNRDHGTTIVVSSHLLAEVEKLASHLGILSRGKLVFQGRVDELRQSAARIASIALATSDDTKSLALIAAQGICARLDAGEIVMPTMPAARIAHLNRRLVENGIDVYRLQPVDTDLESVFMKLVGR
jgi:lantibiotic transport system ATP-binding protein